MSTKTPKMRREPTPKRISLKCVSIRYTTSWLTTTLLVLMSWPQREVVAKQPFQQLERACKLVLRRLKKEGFTSPRLILLIDEFTYIYEYIKEGLIKPGFMKHWKALLENELFSAVVVGQDSMPSFKREFPNDFGVTQDERITYLCKTEAVKLAEEPMLLNGRSRYHGTALKALLELTAGSPFYLQIMCNRLVDHMNTINTPFVTGAEIEAVQGQLITGAYALPEEKFDPLLNPASKYVAVAPERLYHQVLSEISEGSNPRPGCEKLIFLISCNVHK